MGGLGAISGPPSPATLIEGRHGFCRGARSDGGLGAISGPPSPATLIEARHGFCRGAPSDGGFGGHLGAPITCDVDRGAPRLLPGRDERWGVWGPSRGPHQRWTTSRRGSTRV